MNEALKKILLFDQESPFIFTRLNFWVFLMFVLLIYNFVYHRQRIRNLYLFIVSVFFYYKTGGFFFSILIFSTLFDFSIGKAIYKAQKKGFKKIWLALSVLVNLSVLVFFKYDYFFTENINHILSTNFEVVTHSAKWSNALFGTHFDLSRMLPPIGISFFTFQTISYAIDVYKEKIKPVERLTDFGFYVSFFPQLVAGPIVRAAEFIPQLYKPYSLTPYEFGLGFYMILKGLVKKMIIGDFIAVNLIDRVFSNPSSFSGFENLFSLFGYSLQVYCDFSGYTDIAIGVALLMGFYLPKNFNSPYKATNVGDFWKRWHMSLSSWLKDYLYIPMGGNRSGSAFTYISLSILLLFVVLITGKLVLLPIFLIGIVIIWILTSIIPGLKLGVSTNINIMMTMLLGGLWHGSSWMFVIWGGLNGLGLLVYKYWRKISPYENSNHWAIRIWKISLTFTFITFTRAWFRGESVQNINDMFTQIFRHFGWIQIPEMAYAYRKVLLVFVAGLTLHWFSENFKIQIRNWFLRRPLYQKITLSSAVVFVIYQFLSAGQQPFIYFRF